MFRKCSSHSMQLIFKIATAEEVRGRLRVPHIQKYVYVMVNGVTCIMEEPMSLTHDYAWYSPLLVINFVLLVIVPKICQSQFNDTAAIIRFTKYHKTNSNDTHKPWRRHWLVGKQWHGKNWKEKNWFQWCGISSLLCFFVKVLLKKRCSCWLFSNSAMLMWSHRNVKDESNNNVIITHAKQSKLNPYADDMAWYDIGRPRLRQGVARSKSLKNILII